MQSQDVILNKAFELHKSGKFSAAEMAYRDLLKEENADVKLYGNLADTLIKQGKTQEAQETLEAAIEQHPEEVQLKLSLGQLFLQLNQITKAKEHILSLVAEQPKLAEGHYFLGNIYMHEGHQDAALQAFEKAIICNSKLAEAHYNVGVLRYQREEYDRARFKWKAALKYRQDLLPALLSLGNLELEASRYEEAINHLGKLLEIEPKDYNGNKLIGMAKHTLGDIEEAMKHYEVLMELEPNSEEVLTLMGNANRDLNRISVAEQFYEKVLLINSEHGIAKENLQKIRSSKIEGWHFEMLADLSRNQGYEEAINRNVKAGQTVLDIGTGSGILSMMCARAGADKVYSCETIADIAEAAQEVIVDNGFEERIEIFHTRSNNLKVGKQLPEKADVLVSEILDTGLLGEGVLPALRHAKENLLKKGVTIIPKSAEIKGALVQSDHLRAIAPLKDLSGFDLKRFAMFQKLESYQARHLNAIPHQFLTEEFHILPVDFYNLPPTASPDEPNKSKITVKITQDGVLHALAFWFELDLDEKLRLSSGPKGEMIHWGQAIYSLPKNKKVKAGEEITISIEQFEMGLAFIVA
jgi:tetratricopeptide (TPR) repeat protein